MELPLDERLTPRLEMVDTAATADIFQAAPRDLWQELGGKVASFGSAKAIAVRGGKGILANRVMGLGIEEPATEALIDEISEFYSSMSAVMHVQLAPTAQPSEIGTWLENRGMIPVDAWGKLFRNADPPAPVRTDLTIREVDSRWAAEFAAITAEGFNLPPTGGRLLAGIAGRAAWRTYMAFDGDKAIAAAALFVQDVFGWLGVAATLPQYRGRGAQSALIARRIEGAIEAGCKWLEVEADVDTPERPGPSYRNLVKMGFKLAYERTNYRS